MTKFVNWWAGEIAPLYYQCALDTGEFVGAFPAEPSPREPGVWLLPRGATWERPPLGVFEEDHRVSVLRPNGKWEVWPDYRGEVYFRAGDFVVVEHLGDPAEWGLAPMTVSDAEYFLPEGNQDYDGACLRMWINGAVLEFSDDPSLMARKVLAEWEAQGGVIRPVAYDADAYEVPAAEPAPVSGTELFYAELDTRLDKLLQGSRTGAR